MDRQVEFRRRLLLKQVAELFFFTPAAISFSFIGSIVTVAVFYDTGELQKGLWWFVLATIVMFFRTVVTYAYRTQKKPVAHPEKWATLMIVGNIFAGIQWGLIGTLLFPAAHNYRELFTVLAITSYVAGSITAFSPVKWAHLAFAIPASIPPAIYIFFMRDGMNFLSGGMALFFIFCVLYFSHKQHQIVEHRLKVELKNEDLLARSLESNSSLSISHSELRFKTENERRALRESNSRVALLGTHVARTLVPIAECDRDSNVLEWNAAAESLFGVRFKELKGQPLTSLLPTENYAENKLAIKKLLAENHATSVDTILRTSHGERIGMRLFFTPIQSDDGNPVRTAIIMTTV